MDENQKLGDVALQVDIPGGQIGEIHLHDAELVKVADLWAVRGRHSGHGKGVVQFVDKIRGWVEMGQVAVVRSLPRNAG